MSTVRFDATTALVVVDVQNDFAHPDGNLYVEGGDEAIPTINTAVGAARAGGALLVYTRDWHPESTPHFETEGGQWPVHCVKDTWGAAFHDDLELVDGAPEVLKGSDGGDGYSGFSVRDPESGEEHATELDRILTDHGIRHVVVCGLALDVCVKATVLDAIDEGYEATLLRGASRPVEIEPGDGAAAVDEMRRAGAEVA